jgi:CIC family chloride channel protein
VVAQALGGSPYKIEVVSIFTVRPVHFLIIVGIGILVGALGIAVMRAVTLCERLFERSPIPFWLRPATGGVMVGGLALLTPQVLAAGHGAMLLDLTGDTPWKLLLSLIALKLLAAMISLGSGFRGGLFFASLFVGALVGKLCGQGVQAALPDFGLDPVICTLAGMGTLAVAIVGGPVTMSFLVLETTGNLSVAGAVLAACVACSLFVREVFGYSFSTWRLHLRGETIRSAADVGWIRALTVGRMMRHDPPTMEASATVAEFRRRYPLGSTHAVLLIDSESHYQGVLPTPEAFSAQHDADAKSLKVGEISRSHKLTLTPEMNVKAAMSAFDQSETETLAVVEGPHSRKVIGLVTEAFITRRYAEELDKANRGLSGE